MDPVFEPELDPDDRIVGIVTVFRIIDADGGMRDDVRSSDGDDGELDLPTAVGMLAVAQHTILCEREQ